ncbi:MFS transporter [Rubrivivax gelatinosus]
MSPQDGAEPADSGYRFGRRGTVATFAGLCLLMVFDFADRMVLAALLPAIRADWQISDTTAGLLGSILTLGMVLFAFPAAALVGRLGRVRSAAAMGVLWSLASAAGAFAQNVGQLLASRALVGVGEAGYAPASYAWISSAFPRRRRQFALGVFSAAQPIGMAAGVVLGGFIATHWGWQHALGFVAFPGLVVALWLLRGRDWVEPRPAAGAAMGSRLAILRLPALRLAYLGGALAALQWVPLLFFLPSWLERQHGLPGTSASLLAGGVLLLPILGVPLGGWLMDRWNRRDEAAKLVWPIAAGSFATLCYLAAFTVADGLPAQYTLIVLGAFVGSSGGTGPLALTQELVPPALRAFSGTCSVVAVHLLGSVPGPLLVGALSDRLGLSQALLLVLLAAGSAQVLALAAALRHYRRDLAALQPAAPRAGRGALPLPASPLQPPSPS